ncbi:hypothetical protein RDp07_gp76 [Roseobacter phage RD-1410Ws-07]|uniref:Uncharacterized protein n=1 Tax=Roseobacter phage RD-1410Ws-07 TaxID=1815985 RepID=A0A191VYU3_9CAUD|nr:hypothetical protein RDp07_gp76 [Roseobacter phage RD-1410Ws-07]
MDTSIPSNVTPEEHMAKLKFNEEFFRRKFKIAKAQEDDARIDKEDWLAKLQKCRRDICTLEKSL